MAITLTYSHKEIKTVSIKNEDNQTNNNVTNETAARDLPKEIQGWTSPKNCYEF